MKLILLLLVLGICACNSHHQVSASSQFLKTNSMMSTSSTSNEHVTGIRRCETRNVSGQCNCDNGNCNFCSNSYQGLCYPNGLSYPSFNNFTDSNDIPPFNDERYFFKVSDSSDNLGDSISIPSSRVNDQKAIVGFASLVHNNADPNKNTPVGGGIAENVRIQTSGFKLSENGKYRTDIISPREMLRITQIITWNGGSIQNDVRITNGHNVAIYLEYYDDGKNPTKIQKLSDKYVNQPLIPSQFFGSGALIGSDQKGVNNSGRFFGCEPYAGYVLFYTIIKEVK